MREKINKSKRRQYWEEEIEERIDSDTKRQIMQKSKNTERGRNCERKEREKTARI